MPCRLGHGLYKLESQTICITITINHYIYIGSLLERGEEVHLNITVTLFWNKVVWSPNSSSAISSGNAGNAGKLGSGDKKLILLLHFY